MLRPELVQHCWGVASRQRFPGKLPVGIAMETAGNRAGVIHGAGVLEPWELCKPVTRKLMVSERGPLWNPLLGSLLLHPGTGRAPPTGLCSVDLPLLGSPPSRRPPLSVLGVSPTQQEPGEAKPAGTRKGALHLPGPPQGPSSTLILTELSIIPAGKRKCSQLGGGAVLTLGTGTPWPVLNGLFVWDFYDNTRKEMLSGTYR